MENKKFNPIGIVTEYNPFHNGHIHHISKSKTNENDVLIAVMSGNFTQRGDVSVLDKWQKTEIALKNGVDLVVELPFFYAVQPAHIFASGAIKILSELKVNEIVFGSETKNIDFLSLAKKSLESELEIKKDDKNKTFASVFSNDLFEKTGFLLDSPNDILSFSYAKAIIEQKLEDKIRIKSISRIMNDFNDKDLPKDSNIASATSIRNSLLDEDSLKDKNYKNFIPVESFEFLERNLNSIKKIDDIFYKLLSYRVNSDNIGQLKRVYQMNEGLDFKLKKIFDLSTTSNLDELILELKSKRYTFSRIHRLLIYTLLNIKVDQMQLAMKTPYIRILGFNKKGQSYLNNIKKAIEIPLYSNVDYNQAQKNLKIDFKAGKIYQEITGKKENQDIGRKPIIL